MRARYPAQERASRPALLPYLVLYLLRSAPKHTMHILWGRHELALPLSRSCVGVLPVGGYIIATTIRSKFTLDVVTLCPDTS